MMGPAPRQHNDGALAGQGIDRLLDWPPADASGVTRARQSGCGERRLDASQGHANNGRASMRESTARDLQLWPEFGTGCSWVYYGVFWEIR
jgi:hypothetical protein